MILQFKRDTKFRKKYFTPESFAHPAKMDARLLLWLVGKYTHVGEIILDPMAGSGTTMLACRLGRDVILVDLEAKFCKMMKANWEVVKQHPQLGYKMGTATILQGDARNLQGLLADSIISSPSYANIGHSQGNSEMQKNIIQKKHTWAGQEYSSNESNIGNLRYGDIDTVITSPPYEGTITQGGETGAWRDTYGKREAGNIGYSKADSNIGNLKSQSYLSAMLQVYQQCYSVLQPRGLMVLITKNYIRNKQIIRLDLDTIRLCYQAGFDLEERHYRKLPSQSFWRILYHKKYPEVPLIEYEDILVFRKEQ